MSESRLSQSVELYAQATQHADQAGLERPWAWGDYDSEGVRFSFFRTYEELRELAIKIAAERTAGDQAPTSAQRILAQYHAAYLDLQSALLGLTDDDMERAPASGQWCVHQALAHMADADGGFYAVVRYALDRHRSGDGRPAKIPREAWGALLGVDEAAYDAAMQGPLDKLRQLHRTFHERILSEFAGIRREELELPSTYWESQSMSLRFRLHRFDSHMRQHTVQVEKTLVTIGRPPSEAKQLLRLIYAALAEAEGAAIGAPEIGDRLGRDIAQSISTRSQEVERILQ